MQTHENVSLVLSFSLNPKILCDRGSKVDAREKRRNWGPPRLTPALAVFLHPAISWSHFYSGVLVSLNLWSALSHFDFLCCPLPARANALLVRSSGPLDPSVPVAQLSRRSDICVPCFRPHSGSRDDTRVRGIGWGVSVFEFCLLLLLWGGKNPLPVRLWNNVLFKMINCMTYPHFRDIKMWKKMHFNISEIYSFQFMTHIIDMWIIHSKETKAQKVTCLKTKSWSEFGPSSKCWRLVVWFSYQTACLQKQMRAGISIAEYVVWQPVPSPGSCLCLLSCHLMSLSLQEGYRHRSPSPTKIPRDKSAE